MPNDNDENDTTDDTTKDNADRTSEAKASCLHGISHGLQTCEAFRHAPQTAGELLKDINTADPSAIHSRYRPTGGREEMASSPRASLVSRQGYRDLVSSLENLDANVKDLQFCRSAPRIPTVKRLEDRPRA